MVAKLGIAVANIGIAAYIRNSKKGVDQDRSERLDIFRARHIRVEETKVWR